MPTPLTFEDLLDLEAIKRVKYAYIRCLDTKDWEMMTGLLAEDAVTAIGPGNSLNGRAAIVEFLSDSMDSHKLLSSHRVHQPEIALHGDQTATAVWAVDERLLLLDAGLTLRSSGYFTDEMVKIDAEWKIRATSYRRIYEEIEPRNHEGLVLTHQWFDQES